MENKSTMLTKEITRVNEDKLKLKRFQMNAGGHFFTYIMSSVWNVFNC